MRKIFENSMEIKFTVRLDNKRLEMLDKIAKAKKLNSKSEAIRYLIEKEYEKIK